MIPEIQTEIRYKKLLKTCKNIVTREDINLVRKAFRLSLEDHEGERRSNGEPAIFRSLSVAQIVVEELGFVLCYTILCKKTMSI